MLQASARVISFDDGELYWLNQVQEDCLVNEFGTDASPFFFIGR